jgi:hypothetical protein
MKMAVFWDVASCSLVEIDRSTIIALMMEAVSTSETSATFYQTARRNIPEDSHLNLASYSRECFSVIGYYMNGFHGFPRDFQTCVVITAYRKLLVLLITVLVINYSLYFFRGKAVL